jgi:hypothetical protein
MISETVWAIFVVHYVKVLEISCQSLIIQNNFKEGHVPSQVFFLHFFFVLFVSVILKKNTLY